MMIGSYPCCDGPLMIALPDVPLPKYAKDICEHCSATVWHRFSRVDPQSWTEADFLAEHDIDETTKTIKPREGACCPDGQACVAERDWAHPCDRDESGAYECRRKNGSVS